MSEKIEISFDDEEPESKKDKRKIEIDLEEEEKEPQSEDEIIEEEQETAEVVKKDIEEEILNSSVDSFYAGNPAQTFYYDSKLKFPEGIEKGFRRRYCTDLKDTFLNSALENNRYVILSSRSGNVYFIDRFNGDIKEKVSFGNEIFEKTGLVNKNKVYLNSLTSIYKFKNTPIDSDNHGQKIYKSSPGYYIWSNLNLCKGNLVLLEYNNSNNKAGLKVINPESYNTVYNSTFEIDEFISDQIIVAGSLIFISYDNKLIKINIDSLSSECIPLFFRVNNDSKFFYLSDRVYITNSKNELYYIDLRASSFDFKFTGIKSNYINSIAGYGDNIFIGTVYGWKLYKSNGMLLYSYEDIDENKIESVSKNLIIISKTNKIVCHNLNKFQEAEGFALKSQISGDGSEVIESVIISFNDFFVLTKNGVFEAYTNDKLNIHI